MKEIQFLSVAPEQIYELTKVTIDNPDEGEYIINFQNPNDLQYYQSSKIKANAGDWEFRNAIKSYYQNNFGSKITVTREIYGTDGIEVEKVKDAVQIVYTIQLNKLIEGTTMNGVIVTRDSTSAVVTVTNPSELQLSGPPLSGSFRIKCVDPDGNPSYSRDLSYDISAYYIEL